MTRGVRTKELLRVMAPLRAEDVVVAGKRIEARIVLAFMSLQDGAQPFGGLPLAVIRVVAEKDDMPDVAPNHLRKRLVQCLRTLVENAGGLAGIGPASDGNPLAIDLDGGKFEVTLKIMKVSIGNDGDPRQISHWN